MYNGRVIDQKLPLCYRLPFSNILAQVTYFNEIRTQIHLKRVYMQIQKPKFFCHSIQVFCERRDALCVCRKFISLHTLEVDFISRSKQKLSFPFCFFSVAKQIFEK